MELGTRGAPAICCATRELSARSGVTLEIDTHSRQLRFVSSSGSRVFPIAIGKPSTPTPPGSWRIKFRARHPGGVLGSRWMGLNVPSGNYGIHGTNAPWSIGRAVSNGCIRMHNHDIESMYDLCAVGTPVLINQVSQRWQNESRIEDQGDFDRTPPTGDGWQPVKPGPPAPPVQPPSPENDGDGWEPVRPPGSYYGVLRTGDTGQRIVVLQRQLAAVGLYRTAVDGLFGPVTEHAVREFQTRQGQQADGIARPATLVRLGL